MIDTDVQLEEVAALETSLRGLCDRLDPEAVPLYQATEVWASLAVMEKLAAGAKLRMARRAEEAGKWRQQGHRSAADWMGRHQGTSTGAARAALETSKRVKDQPGTDQAIRQGELSVGQANSISDAAAANPDAERSLLRTAKTRSHKELAEACGNAKAAAEKDPEATRRRQHAARSAKEFKDAEGMWNLHLKDTPAIGAEFRALVQPWLDGVIDRARRAGLREGLDAYLADAIAEMFRAADHGTPSPASNDGNSEGSADPAASEGPEGDWSATDPSSGSGPNRPADSDTSDSDSAAAEGPDSPAEPEGVRPTGPVSGGPRSPASEDGSAPPGPVIPKRGSRRPDAKILAFVDWELLLRGDIGGGKRCEIAGIGSVPEATVRDLFGDAHLHLIVTKGEAVATTVNLGRPVTAAQRTALEARGYVCAVPGCSATHHLDIDHVTGWSVTRTTELSDLDWLCRFHHDQKSYRGYRLDGPPGRRRWIHPDGTTDHPDQPRAGPGRPGGRPVPTGPPQQRPPPEAGTLFDDPSAA